MFSSEQLFPQQCETQAFQPVFSWVCEYGTDPGWCPLSRSRVRGSVQMEGRIPRPAWQPPSIGNTAASRDFQKILRQTKATSHQLWVGNSSLTRHREKESEPRKQPADQQTIQQGPDQQFTSWVQLSMGEPAQVVWEGTGKKKSTAWIIPVRNRTVNLLQKKEAVKERLWVKDFPEWEGETLISPH